MSIRYTTRNGVEEFRAHANALFKGGDHLPRAFDRYNGQNWSAFFDTIEEAMLFIEHYRATHPAIMQMLKFLDTEIQMAIDAAMQAAIKKYLWKTHKIPHESIEPLATPYVDARLQNFDQQCGFKIMDSSGSPQKNLFFELNLSMPNVAQWLNTSTQMQIWDGMKDHIDQSLQGAVVK